MYDIVAEAFAHREWIPSVEDGVLPGPGAVVMTISEETAPVAACFRAAGAFWRHS